ncbi:MAG: hypothetical protein LC808_02185 [Actinobacteria bacterium]|nr:hypothetical protein [Actinomycetota bacterium]
MRRREPRDPEPPDDAKLRAVLRRQSAEPSGQQRSPWDIDAYELHAHPDLIDRVRELSEGSERSVAPMFGLPVLVRPGRHAFAIAVGTSTLSLRLDEEPTDVRLLSKPGWFDLAGRDAVFSLSGQGRGDPNNSERVPPVGARARTKGRTAGRTDSSSTAGGMAQ